MNKALELAQKIKENNHHIWKLRDVISFLEEENKKQKAELELLQKECVHHPVQYAEGRHGSSKGDLYYRCSVCDFRWIEE